MTLDGGDDFGYVLISAESYCWYELYHSLIYKTSLSIKAPLNWVVFTC